MEVGSSSSYIEYGVWDNELDELLINVLADRERAFRLAGFWNKSKAGRVTVVDRTITTTQWKPANTGVIPPYIEEKADDERLE